MTTRAFAGSRRFWMVTAAYVAVLFGVQPFLGFGIDAFKERWGDYALDVTAAIVMVVGALSAALVVARAWRRGTRGQQLAMVAGGALFVIGVAFSRIPQERLHYLEYGLLAALLYIGCAASERMSTRDAVVRAAVIGASLGLLDELLQIPWERRYFDWADVLLNVIAVGLGLLVAVPGWNAWSGDQPERSASA